ncbi:hypothetical protein HDU92_005502 [Lobulomyces angularis]|nr:hypothetical protein HDU92_005502 [Lobulomyces angularis]
MQSGSQLTESKEEADLLGINLVSINSDLCSILRYSKNFVTFEKIWDMLESQISNLPNFPFVKDSAEEKFGKFIVTNLESIF